MRLRIVLSAFGSVGVALLGAAVLSVPLTLLRRAFLACRAVGTESFVGIAGVIESLAGAIAPVRFSLPIRLSCANPNIDCTIKSVTSDAMRYFSLNFFKNPIIFSTFAGEPAKTQNNAVVRVCTRFFSA